MRATPTNRLRIYNVTRAYWADYGKGIGVDTLAARLSLPPEAVEACCIALVEARVLELANVSATHPMYRPSVVR
jgi:hypothetical protein